MTVPPPKAGAAVGLRPDLIRILAPNPSPMTFWGTNTYLIGQDTLAVIDPGPDDDTHLAALMSAIDGRLVSHIFVTHSHLDHSPLSGRLSQMTGAPVCAFGVSDAGQSAVMRRLAKDGLLGGGEGVDHGFQPDITLLDAQAVQGDWGNMTVLHTPGHMGNHICLAWQDAVFTGDHVMGWASSLVSPPDGDLTDFMASCHRLMQVKAAQFFPGHGPPIETPQKQLAWLIEHRKQREAQILYALTQSDMTTAEITLKVYADLEPMLVRAAQRNVLAHLVDLVGRGLVRAKPSLTFNAVFAKTGA